MRIAYVTRQYPPHSIGGIGSFVQTLAGLMADGGHDVTVVCASPGQARSTVSDGGVVIERFPAAGPWWFWAPLIRWGPTAAVRCHAALSALVAVRKLERFDVLEAPEWKAEGLLLRWSGRGAVVVHLHLSQEVVRLWEGRPLTRTHLGERLERVSAVLADGVTAATEISNRLPDGTSWLGTREVRLVPPPLLVDRWVVGTPVLATKPIVLFMGHLDQRKAAEVLVAALGCLTTQVQGVRAIFVGRPSEWAAGVPYDEWIRRESQRLGVDCEVRAPVSDPEEVLALYAQARVVAVPSRYETVSMVVLEAMACGRPVVMTDRVGASEWVAAQTPHAVVPVDDVGALAEALRPFLADSSVASDEGRRGRKMVASLCAPSATVSARVTAYRAAVEGRRRRTARAARFAPRLRCRLLFAQTRDLTRTIRERRRREGAP